VAPGSYPGPPGPAAQHGGQGFAPGQPGGYQGQGGWQGGSGYAPAQSKAALGLDKILALSVAGLGVLNFIWGFLPAVSLPDGAPDSVPTSFYGLGYGYLPVLLFVAGLLALGPWEPKGRNLAFPVAVISAVTAIAAVATWISDSIYSSESGTGKGIGLILLGIFAILQALAALGSWLFDAGILKQGGKPAAVVGGGFAPPGPGSPGPGSHAPGPHGPGQQGPGPHGGPGQQGPGQQGPGQQGPGQQGYAVPGGYGGPSGPGGPSGAGQHGASGPGQPSGPAQGGPSQGGAPAQYGPFGSSGPQGGEPSFGAQGGYAPQAPVAPGDPSGAFPQPNADGDDGDDGQHPDVTQQVRF